MKCLLSVCLAALLATVFHYARAQNPPMREGVSVQMAVTRNAVSMPEADNDDAWIVAVAADGRLFFGVKPVNADALTEEMKINPRRRDAKLYIKADARAPFASVAEALNAAREDLFDSAVLLTAQTEPHAPGTLLAPKGLEVLLTAPSPDAAVVQLHSSGQPQPAIRVNNQEVSPDRLQAALRQALQNQSEKLIQIDADGRLPFSRIVQVIDACRSVGAKVVMPSSGV